MVPRICYKYCMHDMHDDKASVWIEHVHILKLIHFNYEIKYYF